MSWRSGASERGAPGLPAQGVSHRSRRNIVVKRIAWDVIGLDHIMGVMILGFAPVAQFEIKIGTIFRILAISAGVHGEGGRRWKVSRVGDREPIGSITETSGHADARTTPLAARLPH